MIAFGGVEMIAFGGVYMLLMHLYVCLTCVALEKLQRRACKLILGKDYSSLQDSLKQLDMLSLEEMIFTNKAKIMYNTGTQLLTEIIDARSIANAYYHGVSYARPDMLRMCRSTSRAL